MSAGQVDTRRWRASWWVINGVYRAETYSARELRELFCWNNGSEDPTQVERQAVGDRYTDHRGWTWERIA